MNAPFPKHEPFNPYAAIPIAAEPELTGDAFWLARREILRTIWMWRAGCILTAVVCLRELFEVLNNTIGQDRPDSGLDLATDPFMLAWILLSLAWIFTTGYTAFLDWCVAEKLRHFIAGKESDPLPLCQLFRRANSTL